MANAPIFWALSSSQPTVDNSGAYPNWRSARGRAWSLCAPPSEQPEPAQQRFPGDRSPANPSAHPGQPFIGRWIPSLLPFLRSASRLPHWSASVLIARIALFRSSSSTLVAFPPSLPVLRNPYQRTLRISAATTTRHCRSTSPARWAPTPIITGSLVTLSVCLLQFIAHLLICPKGASRPLLISRHFAIPRPFTTLLVFKV